LFAVVKAACIHGFAVSYHCWLLLKQFELKAFHSDIAVNCH